MKALLFAPVGPSAASFAAIILVAAAMCGPATAADLSVINKAPPPPPSGQFWAEVDYLAWTVKGDKLPPLVSTSAPGTPLFQAGILGTPGTGVLFGDSTVNDGWRSGMRFQAGYWFDPRHTRGIEVSFFELDHASTGFNTSSGGSPILALPFFDASTNQPNSFLLAFPGFAAGAVSINETSRLLGADALYRQDIAYWGAERFSALIGYRYLHASDRLGIFSTVTVTGGPGAGTVMSLGDTFNTASDFHGVDLGVVGTYLGGPWMLEWRAKVALGANFNEAQINGSTTMTFGGVATPFQGGLFALSSNIGGYTQTRFAAAPEFTLKAGYRFAPGWQVVAGYDLLYWTGVQRAGNLVDTTVNSNLLGGGPGGPPQRPQALLNTSALLAQGFNAGLKHEF
jgi:Putative beta barrel porin-7 (BBP7)